MADVRAFTTRHIVHELQAMGKDYKATLDEARRLERHKCDHGNVESASECIKADVGISNEAHFAIATQDKQLQQYLAKIPSVPVIFKTVTGMQMQKPTARALRHMDKVCERKMAVQDHERQSIMASAGDATHARRRKKQKGGPNPLSVKKKKAIVKTSNPNPSTDDKQATADKPKRKRNRGRGQSRGEH
mmetsp:Transcript_8479/g.21867  ORF Transcript_8479/g.21867 Transcript_8479/m.21867 type:complete len:189 (+) Transcript_8479:98-664(+)